MRRKTSRRDFLRNTAMAGVGMWIGSSIQGAPRSPNEKLNIACVGIGGKGYSDMVACRGENIVAVCDVDDQNAAEGYKAAGKAERYKDYRKMLERKDIDAVTVSTPDHNHAPAAMLAIREKRHVFVQKPLTRTIYEARLLRETAKKYGVATQMGNQGTSSNGLREGVEIVQSGGIGKVTEVHVWTNRPVWPQGTDEVRELKGQPVPDHMAWNEWLGPARERPYNSAYAPFKWRGFWDFGTGALGDMACHTANLPFWALKLEYPVAIERVSVSDDASDLTYPSKSIIRFDFPARGDLPPLKFFWYDGGNRPKADLFHGEGVAGSGSLMVGDKGSLYSPDDYGDSYKLLPEKSFKDYKNPDPWIPRSPGHAPEWIQACKGGKPAMSNFEYAALLTESILLGNLALRVPGRIEWDGPHMVSPNSPEANRYIHYEYRAGWTL